MNGARAVVLSAIALLVLAGCSPAGRRKTAVDVATRFVTALSRHDGSQACELLSDDARSAAGGATDTPCSQAVLKVQDSGTRIRGVQIWGDRAQVKIGADVLFLERLDAGWRVTDAGCKPRPRAAYDCDVGG